MQNVRPFIMCLQISRCISSSSMCPNINRESKFMKKIMYGSRKSKRKWYDTSTDLRSTVNINPTHTSLSMHTKRRMMIRDKLFMEHITDMMSMGEVSDIIKGSIEITHVKITPDFEYVNVFYISSNDDALSVDQEALQKCARIIRHKLSQLRVIGIVPPIQFVQNKQYYIANEVDKRLGMINFEEANEILSKQMLLDISELDSVDHNLQEPTTKLESEIDRFYIQLPVMRHDVLGLDHHKIMSRISSAVSKTKKAVQRRMLFENTDTDKSSQDPKKVVEFLTQEEQRKIFSDFLNKRRKEERRKCSSKADKEKLLSNFEEDIDNEESDYDDDNDIDSEYIEDDIDNESIDNEYIDNFKDETQK
ncbi:uncharacterized protein LOC105201500 [Solenopsis invicta]|uniref:uncharacterized protein LOC105201500 n=1 Tax=Solenopsis invicta TaxID=13686 RepID=UPI000595C11A|nr:uncharacterized protein LOC105201500 [Solenopsis invicta]